jgi:hypothetical protein
VALPSKSIIPAIVSACPLCRERKGKRACPAKGASICSPCCGGKRLVEIDCPSGCRYLTGAHAPAWEGRETERLRDARRVAPHVEALSEDQQRLFLMGLVGIAEIARSRRELTDALLQQALEAARKTLETRERGVLYEHPVEDLRAQGVLHDLREVFERRDEKGQAITPDDRDLLPVLRGLETAVRGTLREQAGPSAFLETAGRFALQFGQQLRPTATPLIVTG